MSCLPIEFSRVVGVAHPVIHVYVGQTVEQELYLLKIKHRQQRLGNNIVESLFRWFSIVQQSVGGFNYCLSNAGVLIRRIKEYLEEFEQLSLDAIHHSVP